MKKRVAKVMALFLAVCMVLLSPASVMAADGRNTNAGFYSGQQDAIETSNLQEGNGEVIGQVSPDGLAGIPETSEQRDEGEVLGTGEIPDITESPETTQEQTMTETQKEEVSKPENEQSLEIQETAEEAEVLQSDEKETKTREAVNGVMEIDITAGPVVIVDEGFAQDTEDQYFFPSKDQVPTLDSFTAWTGPYRVTGNFERIQDMYTSSDPIVRVLGGTESSPIEIELKDANLNNKKDNNRMNAGSAIEIGGIGGVTSAVHMKLTGDNTAIGSAICSGVEVYDRAWLKISGEGSLEAVGGRDGAGIGGASQRGNDVGSTIIIDSGRINATGGEHAAGIGGGRNTVGGTIEINGGSITAQGGDRGAGIGAGLVYYDSAKPPLDIRINGGKVQATGGAFGAGIGGGFAERNYTASSEISIQIGGSADVTAVGGKHSDWFGGAGIGAGYTYQTDSAAVNPNVVIKKIEINGGKVSATGADCAAGIGASPGNHVESIMISDGNVTANGGTFASGIGTGYSWPTHPKKSTVGNIQISGGVVQATGMENSAGIGSADHSEMGNIVIGGGEIHSQGGEYGSGIGSGARASVGDIIVTAGNVTSRGGVNGAGIGTGWTGTAKDILISGGDVFAFTDYVVEDGTIDGLAAGIGGGADGIVQAIKMSGTAEILAISGLESAGIGRGYRESVEVPIIPITIEGTPKINAYATGTVDGKVPSKEISAIEYEGITSCGTNILQGHFKTVLDSENEKQFVVRGDSGAEYVLNMPQNFQSFAVTTSDTGIHKVYVDNILYAGSKEMNEDILTARLQVNGQSANPYWYLQPTEMFTVSFDTQGGTLVESVQVASGENVTKPEDPTKEGYSLQGWYKDAGAENSWDFAADTVDSDLTLYASWSPIQYEVVFDKNSVGAEGSMENQLFTYDEEKNLNENIFKNEGFEFAGWAITPEGEVVYSDKQTVKNLTTEKDGKIYLYAVWNEIGDEKYTIEHYKQNKDGTWPEAASDIETKSAKPGTTVNGEAKSYDGYVFDSTAEGTVISGEVKVDGSLVLRLYYQVYHTVTFDSDGGDYKPDSQSVVHGEKATEPKNPTKEGYIFEGWYYKNQENKETKWNFGDAVTGDLALYAVWTKIEEPQMSHTVSFDSDGGNYTPDNQSVAHGDKATEPKNPTKEGYTFEGWYYKNKDGKEVKWNFDDVITGDLKLTAHWKKVDKPVTPSKPSTPSDGGTTNNGGKINRPGTGSIMAKSVKTGDTSNLILLFGLLAGSAAVLTVGIAIRQKKKKSKQ